MAKILDIEAHDNVFTHKWKPDGRYLTLVCEKCGAILLRPAGSTEEPENLWFYKHGFSMPIEPLTCESMVMSQALE